MVKSKSFRRHLPALTAALVVVGAVLLATVLTRGTNNPSRLQLFFGRLHPLVVHLPIGFLLLALFLEGASRIRRFVRVRHSVPLALVVSAGSAIMAVAFGTLLAAGGGYDGSTVLWHKRLGIGVAVACVAATALWYGASTRRGVALRRAYELSLFVAVALLMAAGHLGGTLTHGPEFLAEYMPEGARSAMRVLPGEAPRSTSFNRVDEAVLYADLIKPVLAARCVACHGMETRKGGLRLDTPEGIVKGGESGPAVNPGKPEESEIVRRIRLPEGHEDAMPPRGRKPLGVAEAELIRWWIARGASFKESVGQVNPPPSVAAILEQLAGPPEDRIAPVLRTRISPADTGVLRSARAVGLSLRPIANGSAFLVARCTGGDKGCGPEQVRALLPLASQITDLDLSGSAVGDAEMSTIAQLPNLTRLHLERTAVSDAGLAQIGSLRHLEYLNLYGTRVTDEGLPKLAGLTSLRGLHLWQTAATLAGAERLRSQLGRATVNVGSNRASPDSLGAAASRPHQAVPVLR